VLKGHGSPAQAGVVALNSGLVLWAAGLVDNVAAGVEQARAALASGAGWQRLEALRAALAAPVA
jgi:anthranilate phosphoribosyltransferase